MKINEFFDSELDSDKPKFDFDVADDVQAFIMNDPMFYRKEYFPKISSLSKKIKHGKHFSPYNELSPIVNKACGQYVKKFNINVDPKELLTQEELSRVCEKLIADETADIKGESY